MQKLYGAAGGPGGAGGFPGAEGFPGAKENHIHHNTGSYTLAPEKKVHLVFVVGPSVTSASAARARVVLEICGLEVKVLGERPALRSPRIPRPSLGNRSVLGDVSLERGSDGDDTDEEEEEDTLSMVDVRSRVLTAGWTEAQLMDCITAVSSFSFCMLLVAHLTHLFVVRGSLYLDESC